MVDENLIVFTAPDIARMELFKTSTAANPNKTLKIALMNHCRKLPLSQTRETSGLPGGVLSATCDFLLSLGFL